MRHIVNQAFGDSLKDVLRDRAVCELRNHGIQQRLLTEAGLTLANALEIAQGQEAAAQNLKKLRSANDGIETVQRVTSTQGRGHGAKPRLSKSALSKPCYRCGATDHWASICRFKYAAFHKYKKRGHSQGLQRWRKPQPVPTPVRCRQE